MCLETCVHSPAHSTVGGILVGEKTEKLTSPEVTYTNQHGKSQKHKVDGEAGEAWALALMWTDRQIARLSLNLTLGPMLSTPQGSQRKEEPWRH